MVRLYDGFLAPQATWTAPAGAVPGSARFSPDGKKIAIGYVNSPRVDVLSGEDLHLLYSPDARGANRGLGVVAWSLDGTQLYATGECEVSGSHPILRWTGAGAFIDMVLVSKDRIEDLAALPQHQVAFGSQEPAWGIVSAQGKLLRSQRKNIADFRGLGNGLRFPGCQGQSCRVGLHFAPPAGLQPRPDARRGPVALASAGGHLHAVPPIHRGPYPRRRGLRPVHQHGPLTIATRLHVKTQLNPEEEKLRF